MSYKQKIKDEIKKALNGEIETIPLERTKLKEHGDVATNIAMILANKQKTNPLNIANEIKGKINATEGLITHIEVVKPGFINFVVGNFALSESLIEVHKLGKEYGYSPKKIKEKILVEYVSANPTGDLHLGHGRQAAIGSCLVNLLSGDGYDVASEFYINDYGEQIQQLAKSAWISYLEQKQGKSIYPSNTEEFMYKLTVNEYVNRLILWHPNKEITEENIGAEIRNLIIEEQNSTLARCNVKFDMWFSETSLYESKQAEKVLNNLKEKNVTYENEGAIWFKAKEFGDVRDRVLVRNDGRPTYLMGDIAYHVDKLKRGYNRLITVWGADHHGQEVSLKGGLKALGYDSNKLEIIFVQLVSLKQGDLEVRMSKRAGTVVTISDLLNEVGADAFRYFLSESHPNNRMVFDIELAKKQDKDNPVFYIQYAHARCCSIFRQITQENKNINLKDLYNAFSSSTNIFMKLFNTNNQEYNATKTLILRILDFPEEVTQAAKTRSPSRIANYLKDLAADFHQFYTICRVILDDENLTQARLGLIEATKITIANGLQILGISAPEAM